MPLAELDTGEYRIYDQTLRKPTDEYTTRKVQKDRKKAKIWINALLNSRQVVIFYNKDGVEKITVGTLVGFDATDLPTITPEIEIINNQEVPTINHVAFFEVPSRNPLVLHLDSITKFICANPGLDDLSRDQAWY